MPLLIDHFAVSPRPHLPKALKKMVSDTAWCTPSFAEGLTVGNKHKIQI